jgi:O-methyltransferase
MATDKPSAEPPPKALMRMLTAYWLSQGIHVAAKLRLADRVKDGPKTSAELAQATGTHAPSLYRLLRMLASEGIFAEDSQGRFGLTPLAECLCDTPLSQYGCAVMMGEEHYRSWGDLLYSVRTGKPAFDAVYGKPIFDYLQEHPEQAKIFDQAMTGFHGPETQAMVDAYDFTGINTLTDIGGGNGSLITTVLRKYPAMKGIVYDLPNVVARTAEHLKAAGMADRCGTIPGSFFERIPPGGDAYLMRHIIHDWTDEQCRTILGHCRKAMASHSKLLVIEMVIPPGNTPAFGKLLDMNMLVLPGGKERTEAEYRALYQSAGFRLNRIVPTAMEVSIVEGTPV